MALSMADSMVDLPLPLPLRCLFQFLDGICEFLIVEGKGTQITPTRTWLGRMGWWWWCGGGNGSSSSLSPKVIKSFTNCPGLGGDAGLRFGVAVVVAVAGAGGLLSD